MKPPTMRGLLRVLKHARDELTGSRLDGCHGDTVAEVERAIKRVEGNLKPVGPTQADLEQLFEEAFSWAGMGCQDRCVHSMDTPEQCVTYEIGQIYDKWQVEGWIESYQ